MCKGPEAGPVCTWRVSEGLQLGSDNCIHTKVQKAGTQANEKFMRLQGQIPEAGPGFLE